MLIQAKLETLHVLHDVDNLGSHTYVNVGYSIIPDKPQAFWFINLVSFQGNCDTTGIYNGKDELQ